MGKTKLLLLSGFLGAGKTTLMLAAAERLRERGERVACVTNDQGTGLIDSNLVRMKELPLAQVEGGCFCCRFDDLADEIVRLLETEAPDVIIAEAVGSCADLAATVVKPLMAFHGDSLDIGPLTAVIDPRRLEQSHSEEGAAALGNDVSYLYRKQLEEANVLVLNKTDLLDDAERASLLRRIGTDYAPDAVFALSARRPGEADGWLDFALGASASAAAPAVDIDYDAYATGEAQLGWLNATVSIRGAIADAGSFALRLADALLERFRKRSMEAAHVKLWAQDTTNRLKLSAVDNRTPFALDYTSAPVWSAEGLTLLLNARVKGSDAALREAALDALRLVAEQEDVVANVETMDAFAPARPVPIYRMA